MTDHARRRAPEAAVTDLGRAIRYLRGSRTQQECAERGELDPAVWSAYECGKRVPRSVNLAKIREGLGVAELALEEAVWHFRSRRLLAEAGKAPCEPLNVQADGERLQAIRRKVREQLAQVTAIAEELLVFAATQGR